jgi:diacylglycerol kinase family enzyme
MPCSWQLLILKATSRAKALGVFLAIEDGSHVTSSVVDVVRVKAFRLEPVPRTPSAPGLYSLDGEPVPFGAIEARPHPRMLRVLV